MTTTTKPHMDAGEEIATAEPCQLFVVGCPRSGTTWVSFLLARHPQVAAFQHAKLFEYLFRMRKWYKNKAWFSFIVGVDGPVGDAGVDAPDASKSGDDARPDDEVGVRLAHVMPLDDYFNLLSEFVRGIFSRVAGTGQDVRWVLDKTPENGRFAPFITRMLPDAHFLHVVRDPRSVFCSQRAASEGWAKMEFPTRAADSADFWTREVEACLRIEQTTDRYKLIRYEDLKADGPAILTGVTDWLGLPTEPGFAEQAIEDCAKQRMRQSLNRVLPGDFVRKAVKDWREELSPGEVRAIEYVAGGLMEKLGYELEYSPRRKPLRVWYREFPRPFFAGLEKRARSITQRLHWNWVGRRLEYPEP